MPYPLGSQVQLQATFQNQEGSPENPSNVTLFVLQPKKNVATQYSGSALAQPSAGVYQYELYLDTAGTWTYCWEGTGAVEAATFDVPLVVTPSKLRTT